jgi:phage shock protein A
MSFYLYNNNKSMVELVEELEKRINELEKKNDTLKKLNNELEKSNIDLKRELETLRQQPQAQQSFEPAETDILTDV